VATAGSEITALLQQWSGGDERARDQLIPLMYEPLRELAHRRLRGAPGEWSLDTTSLVHEVYIRLINAPALELGDRSHFLGLASEIMRNLLVDRARARLAAKRGSGEVPLELDEALSVADESLEAITELDEALTRLRQFSPRQAELLQHHYFGGLSLDESAAALGISVATVKRDMRSARAWLLVELRGSPIR
jgi:RNA polymerase sigma factor (TIGR02999 family)